MARPKRFSAGNQTDSKPVSRLRKRRVGNELSILSPEIQEDLKYVKRTVDKKGPCATYLRDWLDFRRNLFVFLSN